MRDLARLGFGICDVFTALLVTIGVFVGLPARFFVVDAGGALVATLLAIAGVALLSNRTWAKTAARVASFAVLVLAGVLILALATGIAYLRAIQGPVGKGGSVVFLMVFGLVAPYLVILPSLQLLWIGRRPEPVSTKAP